MKLIDAAKIDLSVWDACKVDKEPNFQEGFLLRTCAKNLEALYAEQEAFYFPLPFFTKAGIKVYYQPTLTRFFHLPKQEALAKAVVKHLFSKYPLFSMAFSTRIPQDWQPWFSREKIRKFQWVHFHDFKLNANAKRNLKKAEKARLVIQETSSAQGLVALLNQAENRERIPLTANDKENLLDLAKLGSAQDKITVVEVYSEDNTLLYAGMFLKQGKTVLYLKGAGSALGKQLGAAHFMFTYVLTHWQTQFSILDFGGSDVEGIAQFFKSFGAQDAYYYQYHTWGL